MTNIIQKTLVSLSACALMLAGSGSWASENIPSHIQAAVDSVDRPQTDRERDATRKPAKVLAFAGIKPGQTVIDVFSGGGYYTELLSRTVGAQGKVLAHNNQAYLGFVGDELKTRFADHRLSNVEQILSEANNLNLGNEVADAVVLVLGFHDIYYVADYWPAVDEERFLADIHRALKPGGALLVVDHHATPGSSTASGNSVHRIDPAHVTATLNKAGFNLERKAGFLENPDDDLSISVFEPAVKGKTSRFVHLYRRR